MAAVIGPEGFLLRTLVEAGGLVLGSPSEIEWPEHGNVDAKPCQHQLDGAEHERGKRCARQIPNQINDEDLPETDDTNHNAAA